jgi:hypothetical protein
MLQSDISWSFLVYHVTPSMENCPTAVERTVHCNNAAVYAHGSVATGRASSASKKYTEMGL